MSKRSGHNPFAVEDVGENEGDYDSRAPATENFVFSPYAGDPYRASLQSPISEIASTLQNLLSRRITAYAVGVRDAKTISRWANEEVEGVRNEEVERKLRTAYQVALMLLAVDAPTTVKAWFMGMNPELNDISPIEAIRAGEDREVINAARTFVAGA